MKTIIVDSDQDARKSLVRLSASIPDIHIVGQLESAEETLEYVRSRPVDLVFLDLAMPAADGIKLAKELRRIRKDILIIFTSAYTEYIRESNEIGGDYYLIKPYTKKTLEIAMERMRLLAHRLRKDVYIQTDGGFMIFKNGAPLRLTGKAKDVLELVVKSQGREITNREIYSILWAGREYSNDHMCVLYNTLGRLRALLRRQGCEDLLISTARGQMINTALFDSDFSPEYSRGKNNMN